MRGLFSRYTPGIVKQMEEDASELPAAAKQWSPWKSGSLEVWTLLIAAVRTLTKNLEEDERIANC